MKKLQQLLFLVSLAALLSPMMANAQIYKWKDKNGVTRYSDSPPPVSTKVDTLGKKTEAKTGLPEAAPAASKVDGKPVKEKEANTQFKEPAIDPEEEAARVRAENAEIDKRNKQAKEEQARLDAENCKGAKSRYKTYDQGGRIVKVDENGNRVFMDDAGITAGKKKARADMRKYCK